MVVALVHLIVFAASFLVFCNYFADIEGGSHK
jgi:hypothetical protein